MRNFLLLATASAALITGAAQAQTYGIVVREGTQTLNIPGVGTVTAENKVSEQGGTGTSLVSNLAGRGAPGTVGSNGSLEVRGDKSRYAIGNMYENVSSGGPASPSLTLLKDIDSFSFDWMVSTIADVANRDHHAPAARIHIMDNGIRSEMIWEYVYNGGVAGQAVTTNVWSTADESSKFYLNVRDNDGLAFLAQNSDVANLKIGGRTTVVPATGKLEGLVTLNNSQINQNFAAWMPFFSDDAYVTGFSFGAGSSATNAMVGHVDNLRLGIGTTNLVLNFETTEAAVPEPATWAMMLAGFGLIGAAARRRRSGMAIA